MPPHTRDWIDYLQALAPSIAVVVAIGVGVMQAYLQRQHLKQQLFEKRYMVFESVSLAVGILTGLNAFDPSRIHRFPGDVVNAAYLFGKDINEFIRRLIALSRKHVRAYRIAGAEHYDNLDYALVGQELKTILHELFGSGATICDVFRPYLVLHHETPWIYRLFVRINRWVDDMPTTLDSRYTK